MSELTIDQPNRKVTVKSFEEYYIGVSSII